LLRIREPHVESGHGFFTANRAYVWICFVFENREFSSPRSHWSFSFTLICCL